MTQTTPPSRRLQTPRRTIGLGCMRLSTEPNRDEQAATAVIHSALDSGVTLLDTADVYAMDDTDIGHNERLVGSALRTWSGDPGTITVATKGGLTRPSGRWVPDGRAKHLRAACEASLAALGVSVIDLYQLHAPDPSTKFSTSVRALAKLHREGLVRRVGLSNVNLSQIQQAAEIVAVDSVQVSLSPYDDRSLRNGVAAWCQEQRVSLLAHTPLGGRKRARRLEKDPALAALAHAYEVTPHELVLAWLMELSPWFVPLPGATRPETGASVGRSLEVKLLPADMDRLEERFPARRFLSLRKIPPISSTASGEVVLVMGMPAAGKSAVASRMVEQGYLRLNRDTAGGRLKDLVPMLDRHLAEGNRRVVMDNTYASRAERSRVVEIAEKHGIPVRCVWIDVPVGEAQINAVVRMIDRHGDVQTPERIRELASSDPGCFAPSAQFRFGRALEPPTESEGFRLEVPRFERRWTGRSEARGLIVELDSVVRRSASGARMRLTDPDIVITDEWIDALRIARDDGWKILGVAWLPEVAAGKCLVEDAKGAMARIVQLIGVPLELDFCPHAGGPPTCWCRKPMPGMPLRFIQRHRLDPTACLMVGPGAADRTLADRLNMKYLGPRAFLDRDRGAGQ